MLDDGEFRRGRDFEMESFEVREFWTWASFGFGFGRDSDVCEFWTWAS